MPCLGRCWSLSIRAKSGFYGHQEKDIVFHIFGEGGTSRWIVTQLKLIYDFIRYKYLHNTKKSLLFKNTYTLLHKTPKST